MLSNAQNRVFQLDGNKPIELMSIEEKDDYFMSFSGMKYDEWCEYYKDDAPEKRRAEAKAWLKAKRLTSG